MRVSLRHPLDSSRRLQFTGTEQEVAVFVRRVDGMRRDRRLGLRGNREIEKDLRAMAHGASAPDVSRLWERYLATLGHSARARAESAWRCHIAKRWGQAKYYEVREGELAAWHASLLKDFKPNTAALVCRFLTAAIRLAYRDREIDEVPFRGWSVPEVESVPRESCRALDELFAIVQAAHAEDVANWERGIYSDFAIRILVLALCGLRNAEGAGLGWDDCSIDAEPFTMSIRHQAPRDWQARWTDRPRDPRKRNRVHTIALHAQVVEALREHREMLKRREVYRPDGPVFPDDRGYWRTGGKVLLSPTLRRFVRAAGLANVEAWCTHSLRHTFTTLEAIGSGGDIRAVQGRTGHRSLRALQEYIHSRARGLTPTAIAPFELPTVVPSVVPPTGLELGPARILERGGHLQPRKTPAPKFVPIARAWRDESRRPREILEAARRAYKRAYAHALNTTGDTAAARRAGGEAKRGVMGAWGKAVAHVRGERERQEQGAA